MGISVRAVSGRNLSARMMVVGALLMAFLGVGYAIDRVQGEGPTTCERYATDSLEREAVVHGVGTGAKVAVIGDSYSAGLLLDHIGASWPSRLSGEVHVHAFSGSGFSAGASDCGRVSYADRAARALGGDPDLVVVQGGLNDFDQSDQAIRDGVRRLLAALDGRSVVLVGPPDAPARPASTHVGEVLAAAAEAQGVPYIETSGVSFEYLEGDLHLTPAGHHAFGDLVADAIAEVG